MKLTKGKFIILTGFILIINFIFKRFILFYTSLIIFSVLYIFYKKTDLIFLIKINSVLNRFIWFTFFVVILSSVSYYSNYIQSTAFVITFFSVIFFSIIIFPFFLLQYLLTDKKRLTDCFLELLKIISEKKVKREDIKFLFKLINRQLEDKKFYQSNTTKKRIEAIKYFMKILKQFALEKSLMFKQDLKTSINKIKDYIGNDYIYKTAKIVRKQFKIFINNDDKKDFIKDIFNLPEKDSEISLDDVVKHNPPFLKRSHPFITKIVFEYKALIIGVIILIILLLNKDNKSIIDIFNLLN